MCIRKTFDWKDLDVFFIASVSVRTKSGMQHSNIGEEILEKTKHWKTKMEKVLKKIEGKMKQFTRNIITFS